ncbi:LamG domain-containing protein [Pseudosporangium ferrugineum]|uniref:Concanavalin A-like lectin/glucanase superfamily protein n=1 Tax=Pseudosporangium ferrugineum TaxID=439699 RepID=A0A2T0S462_9ACTN|nr:LamG domain-containing protein [Pseudosporangium ferrugineum]PRY28231.1 concanavalin A-like lectin/glucanase superfamily protein [Pseudosporangium ferrugineum]
MTFGLRAGDEGDETAWKRFCGNGQLETKYNQAPNVPSTAKLTSSPGGKCRGGSTRPVVPEAPTFYMYVSDPDHSSEHKQEVLAEVRFTWRTASGSTSTKTVRTAAKAGDGKTRLQTTPTGLPQNTVISWQVRAQDQDEWYSDWSSPACEYVLDTKAPPAADVDSAEFLPLEKGETTGACAEDDKIREYAGLYSTFTFDSSGTDTTRYRYGLDEDPVHELIPRKADGSVNPGGPVTVRLMPDVAGEHVVNVVAYDAAGNNTESNCRFTVATRKGAGEWLLSEPAGATQAADTGGNHPLDIRPGVTLGVPGPGCAAALGECTRDRAARFAGAPEAYLTSRTTALVDTSNSFAVAAWVRLTEAGQDRTAVSQDGTGEYGFMLGYDSSTKRWLFEVPVNDVNTLGLWTSRSDTEARLGEWTHLVGVFDEETHSLQLIVNGVGQKPVQNRTPWKSRGAVQIGRLIDKGGYRDPWIGDLSDVSVYDRVMPPREAAMLAKLRPVRLGYWPLTAAPSNRSAEFDGNTARDLILEGGARINAPDLEADPFADAALVGAGELVLDGVDDRARTNAPVVPMSGSFTVSARVRLATSGCGTDMSVISQAASKTSGFRIRCSAQDQWELVVPHVDVPAPASGETTTVVETSRYPDDSQDGQHLALVYNAFTKELWFYVDGRLAQVEPAQPATVVNAGGALQIGRALVGGAYGEYFAGTIDDVRVYSGIADPATVALMAQRQEQPQL